ncbi:MAG: DUF4129 domain-containing protein [Pseudomonadota bacterium]
MDLARLEIAMRPRSHWEAIDLGFALARRWFIPLGALWLLTALPAALLFTLLFSDNYILLAVLLWWFKPLYEPPLTYWLSRAVFGERLPLKTVRRNWWRIVRPGLPANLTWRRLSPNRSFYMPVALLEGLKGKERRQRIEVLGRRQHAGTWLTIVGFHFETLLEICLILTLYFLIPEELRWFEGSSVLISPGPIDEWLQLICWLIAMALIAPFYVAGGFALYLHRRSELEGWDIEINFRRTVENVTTGRRSSRGIAAASLLLLCLALPLPGESQASTPGPEQSKQTIEEVLNKPQFGRMEEQSFWRYVGPEEEEKESDSGILAALLEILSRIFKGFFQGIAAFGEVILWVLGTVAIAYLLYHFSRNTSWMQAALPKGRKEKHELPSELFGLDVRPESLPEDIPGEALIAIREGDLRGALSLLYRGTLVLLVTNIQIPIPAGATEGECLELVREHRQKNEADYFQSLTDLWLLTAYAHLHPDARAVERLCHEWREVYSHADR